jgi:hypothetical protein
MTMLKSGRTKRSESTNCCTPALNPKARLFPGGKHSPGLNGFDALAVGEHPSGARLTRTAFLAPDL